MQTNMFTINEVIQKFAYTKMTVSHMLGRYTFETVNDMYQLIVK